MINNINSTESNLVLTQLFYCIVNEEKVVEFDNNGEKWNDTDIADNCYQIMKTCLSKDAKASKGYYSAHDYQFFYDWRYDPMETADKLHAHIEAVKKVTGSEKVAIISRCLGTSAVMAYLSKYGTDSVHGVSFNGSTAAGGEIISETNIRSMMLFSVVKASLFIEFFIFPPHLNV